MNLREREILLKARHDPEIFLSVGLNEVKREGVMTGVILVREEKDLFWDLFFQKNCDLITEGRVIVELEEKVGWLRGSDKKLLSFSDVYRLVE